MSTATSTGPGRRPAVVIGFALSLVALVAALGALGWFGYRAYDVYFDQKPQQTARDAGVAGAETAILNVLTIDPKDPGTWQRNVDAALTGDARNQVTNQIVGQLRSKLQQAGDQAASLSARIKRSAPTEVNADENRVTALVYADVTAKRKGEAGQTQTMGFQVTVEKQDGDVWKATKIFPLDSMALQDSPTTAPDAPAPAGGN